MLRTDIPYFQTNREWYYHDKSEWRCKLTDKGKAIPEVVQSYNEYMKSEEELKKPFTASDGTAYEVL